MQEMKRLYIKIYKENDGNTFVNICPTNSNIVIEAPEPEVVDTTGETVQ